MKVASLWGAVLVIVLGVCSLEAQQMPKPSPSPASENAKTPEKKSPARKPAAAKKAAAKNPAAKATVGAAQTDNTPPSQPATPRSDERGRRRDPFHTLIPENTTTFGGTAPVRLPPGKKGLVIEQLELQGLARAVDGSWIAVVDNRSKRAYFLHEKDQLYNGVVSKIAPDRIVFLANAPGAEGQTASREVVKRLSPE